MFGDRWNRLHTYLKTLDIPQLDMISLLSVACRFAFSFDDSSFLADMIEPVEAKEEDPKVFRAVRLRRYEDDSASRLFPFEIVRDHFKSHEIKRNRVKTL